MVHIADQVLSHIVMITPPIEGIDVQKTLKSLLETGLGGDMERFNQIANRPQYRSPYATMLKYCRMYDVEVVWNTINLN